MHEKSEENAILFARPLLSNDAVPSAAVHRKWDNWNWRFACFHFCFSLVAFKTMLFDTKRMTSTVFFRQFIRLIILFDSSSSCCWFRHAKKKNNFPFVFYHLSIKRDDELRRGVVTPFTFRLWLFSRHRSFLLLKMSSTIFPFISLDFHSFCYFSRFRFFVVDEAQQCQRHEFAYTFQSVTISQKVCRISRLISNWNWWLSERRKNKGICDEFYLLFDWITVDLILRLSSFVTYSSSREEDQQRNECQS